MGRHVYSDLRFCRRIRGFVLAIRRDYVIRLYIKDVHRQMLQWRLSMESLFPGGRLKALFTHGAGSECRYTASIRLISHSDYPVQLSRIYEYSILHSMVKPSATHVPVQVTF